MSSTKICQNYFTTLASSPLSKEWVMPGTVPFSQTIESNKLFAENRNVQACESNSMTKHD